MIKKGGKGKNVLGGIGRVDNDCVFGLIVYHQIGVVVAPFITTLIISNCPSPFPRPPRAPPKKKPKLNKVEETYT